MKNISNKIVVSILTIIIYCITDFSLLSDNHNDGKPLLFANAIIGGKPASGLSSEIVVNINGNCAGVFLDQNHVLTVASCLVNKTLSGEPTLKPEQVTVYHHCLHAPWEAKACGNSVKAKKIMLHPCYEGRHIGTHDIAVIWLNETISAFNNNLTLHLDGWNTNTIFPILDDSYNPNIVQDTYVKFQGWGDISYDINNGNPIKASGLYETEIEFVNTSFCKNDYVDQHDTSRYHTLLDFDIPRKFCVGTGESNAPFGCAEQGTGSGDEGGPLFKLPFPPTTVNADASLSSSSRPTLLGLFSSMTPVILNGNALGDRCNAVGRRSVFTRIAYYRGWVVETMITKDAGFCNPSQRYKSPLDCPAGEWGSIKGCKQCPKGRYGSISNLHSADCSGVCLPGYFCERGSITPTETKCDEPKHFCPLGTPKVATTADGYYAVDANKVSDPQIAPSEIDVRWPNDRLDLLTKKDILYINQRKCEPGHYCIDGVKTPCPVGTYGHEHGLSLRSCDGPCFAGFYCPLGTVDPLKCLPGNWCDGNASIPCPTGRYGSVENLGNPKCSGACIPGYYCPKGSISNTEKPCPAGTYGSKHGLGSSACSGECLEGYYCPVTSTKRNQNECGNPKFFCPAGSPAPIPVWKGYFSQGGNVDGTTRVNQTKCPKGSFCKFGLRFDCPAGQYGNELGLIINSCSGKAAPGYYTPPGSTSATQKQCPAGRYGTGGNIDEKCTGPCAKGHYCPKNSTNATQSKCPAGRYGDIEGLQSDECSVNCYLDTKDDDNAMYTTNALCTESKCTEGYYCPPGSISSREHKCGNISVYCPIGSGLPTIAKPGYYTVNGEVVIGQISTVVSDEATRSHVLICPKGHYCFAGVKKPCPRGKYGATKGLSTPNCTGDVDPGYWSGEGAINVRSRKCFPGRYSSIPGSTSGECQGSCLPGYYCPPASISNSQKHCGHAKYFCPEGSGSPSIASRGYYTVDMHLENKTTSQTTRTTQLHCPIGSYCVNGVRKVCPAGKYGRTKGLTTSKCSGKCLKGYYCPQESSYPSQTLRLDIAANNMKPCPKGKYQDELGGRKVEDCKYCQTGYECLPASINAFGKQVWH